jgi:hypothetical protein
MCLVGSSLAIASLEPPLDPSDELLELIPQHARLRDGSEQFLGVGDPVTDPLGAPSSHVTLDERGEVARPRPIAGRTTEVRPRLVAHPDPRHVISHHLGGPSASTLAHTSM